MVLLDYAQWVNGGVYDTALFTDHRNLLTLFSDKDRPMSCTKSNRDRLTRWGLNLMGMRYVIHHIDGKNNHLADLGSRWGNKFAKKKVETSRKAACQVGLRPWRTNAVTT